MEEKRGMTLENIDYLDNWHKLMFIEAWDNSVKREHEKLLMSANVG